MSAPSQHPAFTFCRSLTGVTEDLKWGDNLVFSVGEKMFAVFDLPEGEPFSMKTDSETFELLVQQPGIRPAPYLARHMWIQIDRHDRLPPDMTHDLLRDAHRMVAAKLSKKRQRELGIAAP